MCRRYIPRPTCSNGEFRKFPTRMVYPQPGFKPEVNGLTVGACLAAQSYQQQKSWLPTLNSNFQGLADILRAADANPAQNRSWRLQFTPDNRVIQTAEEGVAKVFGQRREARHRVHRRGQALDFNPAQAGLLHVKGR